MFTCHSHSNSYTPANAQKKLDFPLSTTDFCTFPIAVIAACDSYRLPMTSASIAGNCTGSDAKVAR